MPKVKINGIEYDFPDGINVLDACEQVGVHVPHFCYHPALKVVGSCRMCKVEVIQKGKSRIDISCNLQVADEMEILTNSPAVQKQQQMTLEYLLKSHPLDCPICDDAGECELQNYYFEHGKYDSRLHDAKTLKRKAFDIGPTVVLDSERCVLCSRCVRFCEQVTHTHELGIFGMGHTEELMLAPDKKLDNDYSGNVVDLCPVGALTDKDFRFKRRVWYLKHENTICEGCSRGCNIRMDYDLNPFHEHKRTFQMKTFRSPATAQQRIQRLKPRENSEVNGHWICDHGRYSYKATDSADRVLYPSIRENNHQFAKELPDVISSFADMITNSISKSNQKLAVVVSPKLATEELFAVRKLLVENLGLVNIDHRLPINDSWYGDNLLRTPDPYPNRTACEWLNIIPASGGIGIDHLNDAVSAGKIDSLLTILADPRDYLTEDSLIKLKNIYGLLRNLPEQSEALYNAVLPVSSWGEYKGTYVNFHSRIQRLNAAFEPLGEARPVWQILIDLSAALKKPLKWNSFEDVFKSLCKNNAHFNGVSWELIGDGGHQIGEINQQNIKVAG